MKMKNQERLLAISHELIRQGIIADPSKPRALFQDAAGPEIDVRLLAAQVSTLQKQVAALSKAKTTEEAENLRQALDVQGALHGKAGILSDLKAPAPPKFSVGALIHLHHRREEKIKAPAQSPPSREQSATTPETEAAFWAAFLEHIQVGRINPTDGSAWLFPGFDRSIVCNFETWGDAIEHATGRIEACQAATAKEGGQSA